MSDQIKQIAMRIKELREIGGISVENMAKEFEVPIQTYMEYENGNIDIPVSLIYKVASKFNVELTAILTGENPRLHTYCLVRKDKGIGVERRRDYKYQNLAYNFLHKKAEPFLVSVDPNPENDPINFNSHPGQEFNYVLEGTLKVIVDGHELILNEGDSLFFDSNAPHGMKALGGQTAKFLAIIL